MSLKTKRLLWEKDGTVRVTHPCAEYRIPDENEQQFLERVNKKDCGGKAVAIDVVDDLPEPMGAWRFRNAWKLQDGKAVIDLDMAKKIREQELVREKRRQEQARLPAATQADLDKAASIADLVAVKLA